MDSHDEHAVPGDRDVAQALTQHIDELQADPRPWRIHGLASAETRNVEEAASPSAVPGSPFGV